MNFWLSEIKEHCTKDISNLHSVLAIVGNKEDLVDLEEVDVEEAKNLSESLHAIYKKVSAKTDFGIEALFMNIADRVDPMLTRKLNNYNASNVRLWEAGAVKRQRKCCG